MASMQQAKQEGAELIEFDVSLTKDGIAVLLHDETLDRTTNMTGSIRDFLFKDLASCNAAANFKPIGTEM
jgi:glycerophosphoryl diester phosphodiesterase